MHLNSYASERERSPRIVLPFKQPSIFQGEPLALVNENATILSNSPSSNQWPSSNL